MTPTHSQESRIGHIVGTVPGAWRVLLKHQLDFCCGGGRTLREACEERGIDTHSILDELSVCEAQAGVQHDDLVGWETRPIPELIDHILEAYHAPLKSSLPLIQSMAAKVLRVHGDKDQERLQAIHDVVVVLAGELLLHMSKEENILFPWIRSGNGHTARSPIRVMLLEHDQAGKMLDELRELTHEFTPPEGACKTWQTLYRALDELNASLRRHIHLENNVLFPRVLAA